jgi:hypothetical protein
VKTVGYSATLGIGLLYQLQIYLISLKAEKRKGNTCKPDPAIQVLERLAFPSQRMQALLDKHLWSF